MPDAMDHVQAANDDHVADALKRHASQQRKARPGLEYCEVVDCREPIEERRRLLGARLCEDCQREEDIRARQFARGRG